ncbi:FAD/NAD(P)-binding domain-containing protein [Lophiostoma macrostomum CBS 122681]|uniref:FAD/NAD(P)-binding domain-containing protein n=1 Tax=Lophiostoma macrostomum CBS 122681 TaxID=1314788 RepID=A0A6A6T9I0_9PLEO|nr:FAD/NAD(P)-binding domain-containing protein [Lophiostoma macrostomum CBS 122681]
MSPTPDDTHGVPKTKRIAIVGGGISGIAALWAFKEHPEYEVHLFEAEARLGGHANSVSFKQNGTFVNVDTGFIAINDETYPHFSKFLGELGVYTIRTDMSFAVSYNAGAFEWGSRCFQGFFGSWQNLFRPWFWRLSFDILRFNLTAPDILHIESSGKKGAQNPPEWKSMEPIGDYLQRLNYSKHFVDLYLVPMCAAPWCIDPQVFSSTFPAQHLIEFMQDHRLLDTVWHTLRWKTFPTGSREYIKAFESQLGGRHQIHKGARVENVRRLDEDGLMLSMEGGDSKYFDHVVLAVHAPQALALLGREATSLEKKILGAFETTRNVCVLHSDMSLLPRRLNARAAWNCLLDWPSDSRKQDQAKQMSITFDMNRLQGFVQAGPYGGPGHVLVTMNPPRNIRSSQGNFMYSTPLISSASVQATQLMHRINGTNRVSFAGAWMGYGFHEDGFVSGTCAAKALLRDGGVVQEPSHSWDCICPRRPLVHLWWLTWGIRFLQMFFDAQALLSSYLE